MPGMTEDARPIPEPLARELRALNDLELGAVIADLGVDPLKPPGAKLRGALASIAEDADPWWEGSLAGHAVDCLAKEPRRGRIAGGGAVDHARATWEGLASLGAAARAALPDPDLAPLLVGHALAVYHAGPGGVPDLVARVDRFAKTHARDREIAREAAGVLEPLLDKGVDGTPEGVLAAAIRVVELHRGQAGQLAEIRAFTGRADPVEGCKLLADEVAARGAKLAVWRDFALSWTGVAADDAAQIGAVRERLHALAAVRAVPGGAHASELAPSSCPAAELPARMGRIWDALARDARANVAEVERLKRDLRAWWGLAEEVPSEPDADAFANVERRLRELDALRVERDAIAEAAGERGTSLASYVRGLREARDERDALARQLAEVRAISHARAVDAAKAEQAAAEARRESADRGRLADAVPARIELRDELAEVKRELADARHALKSARGGLSGWRSWAGLAGRLPPAELLAARGDDGKLRAAVDAVLRIASGAEDVAAELAKSQRARKSLEGRIQDAREEARIEAEARSPTLRAWREWASKLAGWPAPYGEGKDAELRAVLEGNDRRAEVTKEAIYLRDRVVELGAEVRKAGDHAAEWRGWARGHLVGASAIVNDGGLRIELSRLLEAHAATAAALRAPVGADLARMVEAIRAAAGPSTLSGPGALAEHVARLRDLAAAASAEIVGAQTAARLALREIDELTRAS